MIDLPKRKIKGGKLPGKKSTVHENPNDEGGRGHVQMTSVLRRGRLRELITINSDRGGGSKIPKIRLTSFVHGLKGFLVKGPVHTVKMFIASVALQQNATVVPKKPRHARVRNLNHETDSQFSSNFFCYIQSHFIYNHRFGYFA